MTRPRRLEDGRLITRPTSQCARTSFRLARLTFSPMTLGTLHLTPGLPPVLITRLTVGPGEPAGGFCEMTRPMGTAEPCVVTLPIWQCALEIERTALESRSPITRGTVQCLDLDRTARTRLTVGPAEPAGGSWEITRPSAGPLTLPTRQCALVIFFSAPVSRFPITLGTLHTFGFGTLYAAAEPGITTASAQASAPSTNPPASRETILFLDRAFPSHRSGPHCWAFSFQPPEMLLARHHGRANRRISSVA
jgi:hypothetical protein